jgi:hypothetical protein
MPGHLNQQRRYRLRSSQSASFATAAHKLQGEAKEFQARTNKLDQRSNNNFT